MNDQKQVRRTREQIEADEAREAAAKASARKAALAEKQAKIANLANIELAARQSDSERTILRPDLVTAQVLPPAKPAMPAETVENVRAVAGHEDDEGFGDDG